jgi:RNA polymerase sigma factor (sigma-70 family)
MAALVTDSGRKSPARFAGSAILASQSDERLVKLARSGHERAFDAIVGRYRRQLVRFCGRILPESRAEDAVQQAFINAHAALLASDEPVQLRPWLYAITRNAALNMLRQNGWNYEQIPLDFDGVRRPDQVFEQRIELQRTVAALNELPERQRDALVMREFEGRSYDEIALALGANDGAVRQLLNRARVTLRNAASLLTPPPLVARAAASMPPADGRRAAELFAGLGAAGMAKAGATALVAGTLVVGAVKAPLPLTDHAGPTRQKATVVPAKPASGDTPSAHDTPVALGPGSHSNRGRGHEPGARVRRHSGRSGPSHERESERHGAGERESSRGDSRERSGSGGDNGSRERSGSDDSPTSGSDDRSGTSGRSGSDDAATLLAGGGDDSSGTSGTSGEASLGTSGSDDSTSATAGGSGSDDLTTTSDTSGSGSGSSGPGSGETTTTVTTSGPSGSDD